MKKVAIIQPNFLPWKGYFDIINDVDVFIFLDDVQYTKNDWRNRNKIKTSNGLSSWITVPTLGGINQLINEASIDYRHNWQLKMLRTIEVNYRKSLYFAMYYEGIKQVLEQDYKYISELNISLTKLIAGYLGISVSWHCSSDLSQTGGRTERLIKLIQAVNGDHYISGPAAMNYLQPELFQQTNIILEYKDYHGYPIYHQLYCPSFEHSVSIIDLLFNHGPESPYYIWGWRKGATLRKD